MLMSPKRSARLREPGYPRRRQGSRAGALAIPIIERLEDRRVPSATPAASQLLECEPNETIDQAYDLGALAQPAGVFGSIGNGADGAADVTWYQFELNDASQVNMTVSKVAGYAPFASVLSLFNSDPDDFGDPYDADGHRLLAQDSANPATGALTVSEDLGPGEYFIAISGEGNSDFSPVIAGSGFDGATGTYALSVSATDLGLSNDGPTVVSSDPAPGAVLASSPLAIRLEMSGTIDPSTIIAGQNVQLEYSPLGAGGAAPDSLVPLASVNFSMAASELQLFPLAPLAPGNYTVVLAGNSSGGASVLTSPAGVPLGEDAAAPAGRDESFSFEVDGIDGVVGATESDDTPATARDLGNVAGAGLIQVNGAIGVDPLFNPSLSPDPSDPEPQFIPANQVDLYHFQITGPGTYEMVAEVFAGRIGSPLQPGVSLWELDPATGNLVFLAGNIETLNPTVGTDGSVPLFSDSELSAGLTAGQYYLAVADGSNTPSPVEGQPPDSPGVYDPGLPGSAQNGWSTGPYVLNLLVQQAPAAPRVIASSPSFSQVLDAAPTQISVQFSEPMNIAQLALQTFTISDQATVPQVFIQGADGTTYYPQFVSYDYATNVATFQMLDALPNGSYALHLSGAEGLTDLAGTPIAGNDPSGDDVIPFEVEGPTRLISGNLSDGYTVVVPGGADVSEALGTLFPVELQAGVTIVRQPAAGATLTAQASTDDTYVIQLLQSQYYSFSLSGNDLPAGVQVTLTSATGQPVPLLAGFFGQNFFAPVDAGGYTVAVGGWSAGQAASVSYSLTINLIGQQDNAPPLVDGPAPVIQLLLDSAGGGVSSAASDGPAAVVGTVAAAPVGPTASSSTAAASSTGPIALGSTSTTMTASSPSGSLALSLSVPAAVDSASIEFAAALSNLSFSPLGGAGLESIANPAPAVQVALTPGAAPVYGGLVAMVASVYVLPGSGVDDTPETAGVAAGQVAGTSDTAALAAQPVGDAASMIKVAGSLDRAEAGSAAVAVAVADVRAPAPDTAAAGSGAGPAASPERTVQPLAAANVGDAGNPATGNLSLVSRVALAGVIVSATIWRRGAIRKLTWRKGTIAQQPLSAGPFRRHPSHGHMIAGWPNFDIAARGIERAAAGSREAR